ncbi:hypothetical protein J8J20_24555, partial [Mycobacterium tuberculosis]|nr:hypothetical protein [Mycobacterium tuberculosis]
MSDRTEAGAPAAPLSSPGRSLWAAASPAPEKDRAAAEPMIAMVFFMVVTFRSGAGVSRRHGGHRNGDSAS